MKYVAIFLVIVTLVCGAGVGWLYMNTNVTVDAIGVVAVEASTQEEYFDTLRNQLETGTVEGTQFSQATLGTSDQYQFYTYTVRLKNSCYITADMIEVQITPMDGDVMQVGSETTFALPAQSTGDIQATILTDASMHSVREITITYYMWGLPFSIKTTAR
jgi:hypothetical protein